MVNHSVAQSWMLATQSYCATRCNVDFHLSPNAFAVPANSSQPMYTLTIAILFSPWIPVFASDTH
ncbi:MAG: hypothetical protein ACI88A_001997 [Paraglaciecola sp.]|jgi:hypothetical protein